MGAVKMDSLPREHKKLPSAFCYYCQLLLDGRAAAVSGEVELLLGRKGGCLYICWKDKVGSSNTQ